MKITLKQASFLFIINANEYEVRIEKRTDGVKDFNIFINGNYKTTYPMRINANESNSRQALDMYFKGHPHAES